MPGLEGERSRNGKGHISKAPGLRGEGGDVRQSGNFSKKKKEEY